MCVSRTTKEPAIPFSFRVLGILRNVGTLSWTGIKNERLKKRRSMFHLSPRNARTKTVPPRAQKQRKKPNVPLGKSRARSAVCIFALVTLSFAIKIRPTTAFENRSSTFGPISAHRFVPTRLHSSLVRSTCKTSRASSLAATSVANGARSYDRRRRRLFLS